MSAGSEARIQALDEVLDQAVAGARTGDEGLGTGFLLPIGIVLGAGFGIYLVVKRFGATADPVDAPPARTGPDDAMTDTQATRRTGEGTT